MKHGKLTKPSAPGDGQIKKLDKPGGGSGERRTKAKQPVVGRGAKMLKKNMAATTSAAEDW